MGPRKITLKQFRVEIIKAGTISKWQDEQNCDVKITDGPEELQEEVDRMAELFNDLVCRESGIDGILTELEAPNER